MQATLHIHTNQKNFEIEFVEERDKWLNIMYNSAQSSPHLSAIAPVIPEEIVINGVLIQIKADRSYSLLGYNFNEPNSLENLQFDTEGVTLQSCSVEKLWERIMDPSITDERGIELFLSSYFLVLPKRFLIKFLVGTVVTSTISTTKFKSPIHVLQRILTFMSIWLRKFPEDFRDLDEATKEDLEYLVRRLSEAPRLTNIVSEFEALLRVTQLPMVNPDALENPRMTSIYQSINRRSSARMSVNNSKALPSYASVKQLPTNSTHQPINQTHSSNFTSIRYFRAKELAEQLSLQVQEKYYKIPKREFLVTDSRNNIQAILDDYIRFTTLVKSWVQSTSNKVERIHLVEHMIDVAKHCLDLFNYHHSHAIFTALLTDQDKFHRLLGRASEDSKIKWWAIKSILEKNYITERENIGHDVCFLPCLDLDLRYIIRLKNKIRQQHEEQNSIAFESLSALNLTIFQISPENMKRYNFYVSTVIVNFLKHEADRTQHDSPPVQYEQAADKVHDSLNELNQIERNFEEFMKEEIEVIRDSVNRLTKSHLEELVNIIQWKIHFDKKSKILLEISADRDNLNRNLILSFHGEQFVKKNIFLKLTNFHELPVNFKFTTKRIQKSASVHICPWTGVLPPNSSYTVDCGIILKEDGNSRIPIKVEFCMEGQPSFLAIINAKPNPFTKLREFSSSAYAKSNVLAQGGSGTVCIVDLVMEENQPPHKAACKYYHGGNCLDEKQFEEFRREVKVLAALEHDNIVKVLGFGRSPPCIFLEFIEGGDLRRFIDSQNYSLDEAARILFNVASAMDYIHDMGYIHRDLKPANILIQNVNGRAMAKICDFGVTTFTFCIYQTRSAMGTQRFEAPEVLTQYEQKSASFQYQPASDVFSYAMVMYCLFAKTNTPFPSLNNYEAAETVKNGGRPPLPTLSQEWFALLNSCWSQQASDRPSFRDIVKNFPYYSV